jgi:ribonuclease III
MINFSKFEKDINFKFKDKNLIISALTHKSSNQKYNNEKLEFLGDRVIGLALSKKLFDLYPKETEGILDKRFASLVNRKTCCEIAWSLNIQNHVVMGNNKKKITKSDEKILSDCCEAVIGAIYIDRGFETVKNYIIKVWKKFIDKSGVTILDPKTKLQEFSLKKYKKLPIYRVINFTGPKHNPIYKISVSIEDSKDYIGSGSSKQIAQLDAAAKLLKGKNIK